MCYSTMARELNARADCVGPVLEVQRLYCNHKKSLKGHQALTVRSHWQVDRVLKGPHVLLDSCLCPRCVLLRCRTLPDTVR